MIIIIIDVAAKWLSRQAAAETAVPGSNAALRTMFTLCINNLRNKKRNPPPQEKKLFSVFTSCSGSML